MTPVWYASAEWHLYGRELDPDAFRLADKNLRLKKRVTAGFRCNAELREDDRALPAGLAEKIAEVMRRHHYMPLAGPGFPAVYEELFRPLCTAADQHGHREFNYSPVNVRPLRGFRLFARDLNVTAKLAGVFTGMPTYSCAADHLEILALEAGRPYQQVLNQVVMTGQSPEPPTMQTLAVEKKTKRTRKPGYFKELHMWDWTGLYVCHELGVNFVQQLHMHAVDALRYLPFAVGEKVWLFCQTKAPVRGQQELWTPDQWWPFVFVKVGGQWHLLTGVDNQTLPATWHFFQQVTRVKAAAAVLYARTFHPTQLTLLGNCAWNWQRVTDINVGCTQENVRAPFPPEHLGRRQQVAPADLRNCLNAEAAFREWRIRLREAAVRAGADHNVMVAATLADEAGGMLWEPTVRTANVPLSTYV